MPPLFEVTHLRIYSVHWFSFSFFNFIYFLERGEGREKEKGKKHPCVRETSIGCLLHTPNWGPGPQPRHVLWPGIELATLWLEGRCPSHWAVPLRAVHWISLLPCHGWYIDLGPGGPLESLALIPEMRSTSQGIVDRRLLPPIQCQQESPFWGMVKG